MSEVRRIEDQVGRSFEGEAWHGPALAELLADVTAAEAAARPLPMCHSIWEIVSHLTGWRGAATVALEGEALPGEPPDGDWPGPGEATRDAWDRALARLTEGHRRLREAIARQPEERLAETVPGRDYSFYRLLHGIVQHDLYHAGQIALLKKALRVGGSGQ
jgi:uncharacterized damage-inducible protein DinB